MSPINFINTRVAAAVCRGVRQCVVVSLRAPLHDIFKGSPDGTMQVFDQTRGAPKALAEQLRISAFDDRKASVFIWLGKRRVSHS